MIYGIKRFGQKMKEIRLELNYRQKDISHLVGINVDTLRRIEGGFNYPSLQTLDLLSMVYKRDLLLIYKAYCETPNQYIERTIKEITPIIRNHNYKSLGKIAEDFRASFSTTTIKNLAYINDKVEQFHEYLLSLYNVQRSLKNKSRNDLIHLMAITNINLDKINNNPESIHLDKLEIRIFVLMSVLFRFNNEFRHSQKVLSIALDQLNANFRDDSDYLNFYLLIVSNLMTVHHREDNYKAIQNLFHESLGVIEDKIGIKNLSTYLIRVGINKYYTKENNYNEIMRVVIGLLEESGYEDVASRYKKSFSEHYPFLVL